MSIASKKALMTAAACLAVAPVAAQAGTRAETSPVSVNVQRGAPGATDGNEIAQFSPAWILLLLALIAALVAVVSGGRSRGA